MAFKKVLRCWGANARRGVCNKRCSCFTSGKCCKSDCACNKECCLNAEVVITIFTLTLHHCNTFVTTYILIKPCYTLVTLLLQPYYTMLHPCSTFITSLLNNVTALHSCNTFVTSYNIFVASLLHHVTPL